MLVVGTTEQRRWRKCWCDGIPAGRPAGKVCFLIFPTCQLCDLQSVSLDPVSDGEVQEAASLCLLSLDQKVAVRARSSHWWETYTAPRKGLSSASRAGVAVRNAWGDHPGQVSGIESFLILPDPKTALQSTKNIFNVISAKIKFCYFGA